MARMNAMTPDTRGKEKIIGGILDIGQLFWLIGGAGVGAVSVLIFFQIFGPIALLSFLPPVLISLPFAFKKVEDFTLAGYLIRKYRFMHSPRHYCNYGVRTFEFSAHGNQEEFER